MSIVAVDAMGGDNSPASEVRGALLAVREARAAGGDIRVILVGDRARLQAEIDASGGQTESAISVHHASEVVTMDDHPARVFRTKADSSMRVAYNLCKGGKASAVVSAGNSGASLTHAQLILRRLSGVARPGIATAFPAELGGAVVCDTGANVDVKPAVLAQFGILGAIYNRVLHGRECPKVGLLANGSEANKGTAITREAHRLLSAAASDEKSQFDFVGYVEGNDVFAGQVDVVATGGFAGNILLKAAEGASEAVYSMLLARLERNWLSRAAGSFLRSALNQVKATIDYSETGGAPLVGVKGVAMICHGRSDANAIKNAVLASDRFVQSDLPTQLESAIECHRSLWGGDNGSAGTVSPGAEEDTSPQPL